jgi:tetratricopeptide (TPR) repeat protein
MNSLNKNSDSNGQRIGVNFTGTIKEQKTNPLVADKIQGNKFKTLEKLKMSSSDKSNSDGLTMKIINTIVKASIFLTVFLMPLFFAPNVPSVLELNKQALLVLIVGVGFLTWVGKMAWKNEIRFKKTFMLVPIITFFAILGLSTIFSQYREQSMWGFFGGEGKSLITLLFFIAFFFLVLNTIKTQAQAFKIIAVLLISGFISALFGVLQIWEVYVLPFEFTKNPFFNTIGSIYTLAVYVGALFLLSMAMFLSDVSKILKIVLIALSFFFFFVLMVINFKLVWIALIFCMAFLFGVTIMNGSKTQGQGRILPMIFLVLTILMILRVQPLIQKNLPVEILLNHSASSKIALSAIKESPMIGSGPTTYSSVYQKNRPENLGDYWSVNFNSASSYFLTLVSTTGILGGLAFLFLTISGVVALFKGIAKKAKQKGDQINEEGEDYMAVGVGMVWLFITILLFIYLANITILFLWWFSLALFLAFLGFKDRKDDATTEFVTTSASPKSSLALSFVFVLVIIGFIASIYLESQKYFAATHFNKALVVDAKGEDLETVSAELVKAVEFDINRDVYYRNLSIALFAQANKKVAESEGEKLTADEAAIVSNLIRGSIESATRAQALSQFNVDNYISLARVYEGVLVTMEGADGKAVEAYQAALKLDPNNPAIYQNIASIYVSLSDVAVIKAQNEGTFKEGVLPDESLKNLALARENVNKALKLKPDYTDANLLAVGIYEREGNIDGAIEKGIENRKQYPTVASIAFQQGLFYYKKENLAEAKKEFKAALSMDKDYANAIYFLGLVLDKEGDKKGALEQFKAVSVLNPDNADLKKIVSNIESGKDTFDGLEESSSVSDNDEKTNNQSDQPKINPNVEAGVIPEEATPSAEEIETESEDGNTE